VLLGLVEGVEIVGEARDGEEALRLAQETEPHLVILDVNMPRLDGLAAAEALLAMNPQTQLIVHTSEVRSERLRQAERLGIHINDKANPDGLVKRLEAAASRAAETQSAQYRLQTAVLAALVGSAPGEGVLVATPDGGIPFYNAAAAGYLGWPFPPRARTLAEAWEGVETFHPSGRPLAREERPISRALAERKPAVEREIVLRRQGELVSILTGATPLFDDGGGFLGVAGYFRATGRDLGGFVPLDTAA
jgi:CheY-like chemotaxis protein